MKDLSEYRCCSMHDSSGRRGVWYKRTEGGGISVVGGREGDDAEVVITDPVAAKALEDVLAYGAWMLEESLDVVGGS